jgi:hypothetical protein
MTVPSGFYVIDARATLKALTPAQIVCDLYDGNPGPTPLVTATAVPRASGRRTPVTIDTAAQVMSGTLTLVCAGGTDYDMKIAVVRVAAKD